MRTVVIGLILTLALLLPLTTLAAPGDTTDPATLRQLAAVRQATAKYHNVDQALADGYTPSPACSEIPGTGAMGIHYGKSSLAADLTLDPLAPEYLLYIPTANGLRLVAVEYFVADVGQPRPSLFGRGFEGPMPGHGPGMPQHYDLHVWLWQANPNGIFAQWNPTLRCG